MAHVRQANKFGKPSEEHSEGYTASGESEFSRRASHGKVRFNRGPLHTAGPRTLYQLIGQTERQIEFLESELKIEDNPTRRAKLARNVEIKAKFLSRLLCEAEALRHG